MVLLAVAALVNSVFHNCAKNWGSRGLNKHPWAYFSTKANYRHFILNRYQVGQKQTHTVSLSRKKKGTPADL